MRSLLNPCCALAALLLAAVTPARAAVLDTLSLGDPAAEHSHGLDAQGSDVIAAGGLGETARRLLPATPVDWQGGRFAFVMKVDPALPTYFTVRFWGSDRTTDRLILYCEGKQIGYRHLGDIETLDSADGAPAFNGRFFYNTSPLPLAVTKGKTELHFEIRSTGDLYGYAGEFSKYQKQMTEPTRGIYRVYTHTDGCFAPPAGEKQGALPAEIPVRANPGPEVLADVQTRVNRQIDGLLASKNPLSQAQLWFLARTYPVKWTDTAANRDFAAQAAAALDRLYVAFKADPTVAQSEKSNYNADWFGLGPAAQSVVLLAEPLQPFFDQEIAGAPGVTRRAGWSEMFVACRDWHRLHRRQYTNQSMINDTYGIYLPNRGVALLTPKAALPEGEALHYLYEACGLQPWLGSEENGAPLKPLGDSYLELTAQGLTKELGFVGYYGEVLDWMTSMYNATRPSPTEPGDQKIRAQLIKAAKARAIFRTPALDNDGNRAMRAETIIGWRDQGHYPGDITYQERPTWDASAIASAAATLDPALVGYAQQMFADNQFFATVAEQARIPGLRTTAGILPVVEDYQRLAAQPASPSRLPMTAGQPDFVFTDEEDGVVALKHAEQILYVSLYWRARESINYLARIHFTTPQIDRLAVVREDEQFEPDGRMWTRPDWTNMGFGGGGLRYPGDLHSAEAGETLPIAKIPPGADFKAGQESPFAGRASYYQLHYGPYLIGMNTTAGKTFELPIPAGYKQLTAPDLVSGQTMTLGREPLKVGPHTTIVLYLATP